MAEQEPLRYCLPTFSIEAAFWKAFSEEKISRLKLSEEDVDIGASLFPLQKSNRVGVRLANTSIRTSHDVEGVIRNFNSIDSFKSADKAGALQEEGEKLRQYIASGEWVENARKLVPFLVLSYCDLKRHLYLYLCAAPSLLPKAPFIAAPPLPAFASQLSHLLPAEKEVEEWWRSGEGMFGVVKDGRVEGLSCLSHAVGKDGKSELTLVVKDHSTVEVGVTFAVRNLLAAVFIQFGRDVFPVRLIGARLPLSSSVATEVHLPPALREHEEREGEGEGDRRSHRASLFRIFGMETDNSGKVKVKKVDLSSFFSPYQLAETGVDLNLRLLRWRSYPDVEVEKLKEVKCLLLGAGTLGCSVARSLLGWGVRHITFVDNGNVSYSNPARQSLYTFDDAKEKRAKAEAAAAELKRIFPSVQSEGHVLSLPMPDHPPLSAGEEESLLHTARTLRSLISEHDMVFMLTDSREARWFGTAVAAQLEKLAFTAAVGVDSYVCIRHGKGRGKGEGCYFCNDVVGVKNSQVGLALDRQCTVTRPAAAMLASAYVVELAIASYFAHAEPPSSALGSPPQQLRGYLSNFEQMHFEGKAFEHCTACSAKVLDALSASFEPTIARVVSGRGELEQISGLAAFNASITAEVEEVVDIDSDDDKGDDIEE
eukprot:CAMPEP_0113881422 /NCGR_PEP_ID=MMETSP0780_2-20120614/8368_1 /TAXON_ID=652834 /ORGANISM="Palpitomonas bilix" /LENGTH=652 /DNA_ID=CAMNT_0000868279 /DNA_START=107 /DNA_END=2065 /DNA_ORIENTATION=- /assembly_acc=CAM_ASM_000599